MKSMIANAELAPQGEEKIEWVRRHMPVLDGIAAEFERDQPFRGLKAVVCVHLEAKTAYLADVLRRGGAEVYCTGSNPLSTQDDVCAALAQRGVTVLATHACTPEEYHRYECLALSVCPHMVIDDGGDM
ncbi:MAG: adenosylhomocysteinase, partial [Eubacteriales bacterium]|nr:adenosylhomocysteinase [Eubacteriales bacterium]